MEFTHREGENVDVLRVTTECTELYGVSRKCTENAGGAGRHGIFGHFIVCLYDDSLNFSSRKMIEVDEES